ncbi:MAG: hypothetical protein ABFS21_12030 [Actinomycetota bacterium]
MTTLEERLMTGLRHASDAVPEAVGDLAAVKRVGRWRSMMRRGSLVAAAAAAVTIVAIGSMAVLRPASFQSVSETIAAADETTVTTAAAEQTPTTEAAAEETVTTIGVAGIDPASIPVGLSEYELDLSTASAEAMRARPQTEMSASLISEVQSGAAEILTDISAEPPYSATLVQQAGYDQFVLIEHADGSCLRVIEFPRTRPAESDLRGCVPQGGPVAWEAGGLNLIAWWGLPETASQVVASPDCGPAAMCIPENSVVLEGVAVLPTRYMGLSAYEGLPVTLTAYDEEGTEIATDTIVLPPVQVVPEEGRLITLDGENLLVEMPEGMPFDDFSLERGGLIRDIETGVTYSYNAVNRIDDLEAAWQVPSGEVSLVEVDDEELRGVTAISVGLERGTVFVGMPGVPATVDPESWAGAFVDLVGDGEQTLVLEAGPGYELFVSRNDERRGTKATLIGHDGVMILTTGGCFFDTITPSSPDLQSAPREHERVGTILLDDENSSATWCVDDITVNVFGAGEFVDRMVNELTVTP